MTAGGPVSAKRPRIAWLAIEPLPYLLALFQALRDGVDVDQEFFFCAGEGETPPIPAAQQGLIAPESSARRFRVAGRFLNPQILRAVWRRPWDMVVLSGYAHPTMQIAVAICLLRRIPFAFLSDTHLLRPRPWWVRLFKRLFLAPIVRRCGAAFGLGRLQRDYFLSYGVPEERIFTIAPTAHLADFQRSVDTARQSRDLVRRECGVPDEATLGIYVGRLVPVKGADLLVQALARLEPGDRPHLLIVGDGPLRTELERLSRDLALPVHFLGYRANDTLPRYYAASDFYVLSSRQEGWGVAVAEAMSCGLPVVLSDQVGAAYDLLEEGRNGFLVPAGDVDAWAQALAGCVRKRSQLAMLGEASRRKIQEWEPQRSVDAFARAVECVLGNRTTGR